MEGVGDKI